MSSPLPNRLNELRTAAGLRLTDVAARVGVTERTVNRWELGQSPISDEKKFALSDLFGVGVVWLMGWEDGDNGENGDGGRAEQAA